MASINDPRNGIAYGWDLGENGWKTGMDANLKKLGTMMYLSAAGYGTNTPPGTPAAGDLYVIGSAPTGVWVGHAGEIACYVEATWYYVTPQDGYLVLDETTNTLHCYKGTWSTAGPTFTF